MRNIFKGGPLDGNVIMTSLLEDGDGFTETLPLEEYDGDNPPELCADGLYARTWYWTGIGAEATEPMNTDVSVDDGNESAEVAGEGAEDEPVTETPAKPAPKVKAGNTLIDDLRERREKIRCNRNDVSELAGLSVGVIARIETKGGSEEENRAYLNALEHLERTRA